MSINVAVVGLGKMGLSHLAMINSLSDFNVVAICDTAAMVGAVIEKYGGLHYVGSFDEVLKQPDLQAIIVATPTSTHDPIVRAAMERGLHVFCEKPLTLSADTSEALARIAREKRLVAQVGYHNRFIATFGEVKKLLASGALGRVTHVLGEAYGPVVLRPAKATWRSKSGQGGGCLYDYAAHPLNLLNWYFGRPLACSGAVLKSGFSVEVEDEVYATLGFGEGVTGQLSVNWSDASVRKMTTRMSVWGDGGKIFADRQEIQVFLTGNAAIPPGYEAGWNIRYITELTPPVSFYLRGEEYTAQLESFGRSILSGTGEGENSFAASADTDVAIEMIQAAAAARGSAGTFHAAPLAKRRPSLVGRILGR